jgi:type VI secretion system protein ImpH
MATTVRQYDPGLDNLEAPFQGAPTFGFFQAVRLLRRLFPRRKPLGGRFAPDAETVRFTANPTLAFPASEIQELRPPADADSPATMQVNIMGLSSPQGVLPAPYTELIIERTQKKDYALRDFLDIFNHRFISFFYRAWEKHHFFVSYELAERDVVSPVMLSLLGLGTEGLAEKQLVPDQALIFYSGLITQKPRSAQNLKQLLTDFFGVHVEIEQFVAKWIPLQTIDQTILDDSESPIQRLGFAAIVGDEVWDQQSTVRVKIGPLTADQYFSFLPRNESQAYRDLRAILKFWSNDELDFEVELILKREDVSPLRFDLDAGIGPLLGWTTWVKNREMQRDPDEATLYIGRNEVAL